MDIQIFTAGGTIDKVYFDAKSEYAVGDPQITDIMQVARVGFDFSCEVLIQKDSLDMTDTDRDHIARRIAASSADRIILTLVR